MMPEESHTSTNGFHLAKNIVEHLKLNIGKRRLAEGDNFDDYGLWHARITGLFAEAGAKENLIIEVRREFRRNQHSDFLNRYLALCRRRNLRTWQDELPLTDVDVIYLNPADCSVIAMCEYENEGGAEYQVDNILKFQALASSNKGNYQPALCIVSFFFSYEPKWTVGDELLTALENLVKMISEGETVSFKDKMYEFPPMKSWWLLIPFYGTRQEIHWRYSIINPQGKPEEEKEFSLKINM
jgi:hypothetical protein